MGVAIKHEDSGCDRHALYLDRINVNMLVVIMHHSFTKGGNWIKSTREFF